MLYVLKFILVLIVVVVSTDYLSRPAAPLTHDSEEPLNSSPKDNRYHPHPPQLVPDKAKDPRPNLTPLEIQRKERHDFTLTSASPQQLFNLKFTGTSRLAALSHQLLFYDQTQDTALLSQRRSISDDTHKSSLQTIILSERFQATFQSRSGNRGLKTTQWLRGMQSGLVQPNRESAKVSRHQHHNLIKRSYSSLQNPRNNYKPQYFRDNTDARSPDCMPYVHSLSCFGNDTFVNCSSRELYEVPTLLFPNTTTTYLLAVNRITHIKDFAFTRYTALKVLVLSKNNLWSLSNDSFAGLKHLLLLDLSRNDLSIIYHSDLPVNVFAPLVSLEILMLNDQAQTYNSNKNNSMSFSYPDRALSKLTNLKELSMNGLLSTYFGTGFRNLTKLHKLILGGYCNIRSLDNITFTNVPNVKYLSLQMCDIRGTFVEPGAFSPLTKLVYLDLSDNYIGIKHLNNIFYGLRETTTLKHLCINKVNDNRFTGRIQCLESRYISHFPQHLEVLEAGYNDLECVDRRVIKKLSPTLRILDVSGNSFAFGSYLKDLRKMKNLAALIYNTKYDLPKNVPSHKKIASNVFPHYESVLPGTSDVNEFIFKLPPKLQHVKITHTEFMFLQRTTFRIDPDNKLESLIMYGNYFPVTLDPIKGLPKLTSLDLHSNNIKDIDYSLEYWDLPSLTTLDLSSNLLRVLDESFLNTENLTSLNLSYNQINIIDENAFLGFNRLKELYLRGNRLRREFLVNMSHLPLLELLDLSENVLTGVPEDAFQGLLTLKELHLENNLLDKFLVNMSHLINLKVLDLSNNRIALLFGTMRKYIDLIQSYHGTFTLNLAGNPISCNCNNFEFLRWLSQSKFKVEQQGAGQYKCIYSDNSLKYINDRYKSTFATLSRECISNFAIFLVSGATTLFLLCLIIGGIAYRFRWNLRYFYYAAYLRYKKAGVNRDADYEFDVFISYAEEDVRFVIDTMSPQLENRGVKMLIHGRDFVAGKYIASNIVKAVCSSRKTLVVLTRDMMNSYWCGYEVQMANMESVQRGKKVLIFLLMEKIPEGELGVELLYNIRNNTYIPYPDTLPDDRNMGRLWDKLVADIKN